MVTKLPLQIVINIIIKYDIDLIYKIFIEL